MHPDEVTQIHRKLCGVWSNTIEQCLNLGIPATTLGETLLAAGISVGIHVQGHAETAKQLREMAQQVEAEGKAAGAKH